jgi:hypothetical protein
VRQPACATLSAMDLEVPVSLLEDLHAAAAASSGIHLDPDVGTHFDICSVFDPEDAAGCACGIPRLLRDLAELMPLPDGARRPYRPEWVPSGVSA